jgi:histone H3/H4
MNVSIEGQLTQDALALNKLNKIVVKSVVEWNPAELSKSLQEYVKIKKRIKITLIDNPVVKVSDPAAQDILKKINQDDFQADRLIRILESQSDEPVSLAGLDETEIEELGSDLFYSWYSHYEYIEALYDIGSLIVGISIPKSLNSYVSEARSCFAFQQYNAVYGLCRTILESAVRHTCERKGLLRRTGANVIDFESYKPSELIYKAAQGKLRERLKDIYSNTSTMLHGRKTINSKDAKAMFRNTLEAVQDLYK